VFWIDLAGLDLSEGAPVLRLPLSGNEIYAGEASASLAPADPFVFLEATPD
jgi:choloylglycine hydrolase